MRNNILIFGGTAEGRILCQACSRFGRTATVCTATEYGREIIDHLPHVTVRSERMDAREMATFIAAYEFSAVVDATHPYATEATKNIHKACLQTDRPYIRVVREASSPVLLHGIRSVPDMNAAVAFLAQTSGNILITTGSKDLALFCHLPGYRDRLYVRVLPDAGVIAHCNTLGIRGDRIIAMQGPFSHDLNRALLRQISCAYLVTKDTGPTGGFDEKISAARACGTEVILVQRSKRETGYSLEEALSLLGLAEKTDMQGGV